MSDRRRHRGAHPNDAELFDTAHLPDLQAAVAHLAWLLTRGYAERSALKLVGDRFRLTDRQRLAVRRGACSDQQRSARADKRVSLATLRGARLDIDGFNLLTTVESALAGGVILHCRDDAWRDMASMHGSYRQVAETVPAVELVGTLLADAGIAEACWWLDQPVSNSGRLAGIMTRLAAQRGWNWSTQVVPNPDPVLCAAPHVVATADSLILDRCARWCDLAGEAVRRVPDAWILPIGQGSAENFTRDRSTS